jgi:L-ascorbate metabolism protein UlaG (beta-lactamase superfamily)
MMIQQSKQSHCLLGILAKPPFNPLQLCLASLLWMAIPAQAAPPILTGDQLKTDQGNLVVLPIHHATLALGWNKLIIYVDPAGGVQRFASLPKPDIILITDVHGDHLNEKTLQGVVSEKIPIIAPSAAVERLPSALKSEAQKLDNGQKCDLLGLKVEAIPAYNQTEDRLKFHPKGRGNGYVLTLGNTRVYISGDTEDIPEMRSLKSIDVAFLCMNLPYTMTVEQAADAVREFKPKIVYPYHCRGSDLEKFKALVGKDTGVEVRIRDWYRK